MVSSSDSFKERAFIWDVSISVFLTSFYISMQAPSNVLCSHVIPVVVANIYAFPPFLFTAHCTLTFEHCTTHYTTLHTILVYLLKPLHHIALVCSSISLHRLFTWQLQCIYKGMDMVIWNHLSVYSILVN